MTLVVTSMALAPSLIVYKSAEATEHCTSYKGKSSEWVAGCKQGWSDHDNCYKYDPNKGETTDWVNGYKVGWKKGSCK
ncbi:MAG: hypothetical protein L0H53_12165 [Candidatus Nitrosocosmicus sp.]|nr:hypothetical protein [Candidatus Nitrosocosmicus sp.]